MSQEQLRCARSWSEWEMRTVKLVPDMSKVQQKVEDDEFVLAFARIEWSVDWWVGGLVGWLVRREHTYVCT